MFYLPLFSLRDQLDWEAQASLSAHFFTVTLETVEQHNRILVRKITCKCIVFQLENSFCAEYYELDLSIYYVTLS